MPAGVDTAADPDDVLDEVLKLDLADPKLYGGDRPERIWRTMRAAGRPLRLTGMRDHWAITRYRQVREVFRHSQKLSSRRGMRLGEKPTDIAASEASGGLSMIVADDPGHGQMRRALDAALSPKAMMRRLSRPIEAQARQLIAEVAGEPSVEFVAQVATPLLTTASCDLLGIPASERPRIAELTQMAFSGSGYATAAIQVNAHTQLLEYCGELLRSKLRHPADDLATILAQAQQAGVFSREAAIMNCHDFVIGANASARYILTSVPITMLTQPDFWAGLRAGQGDLNVATEELLRYETPINHVMRTLLEDLEIGGVTMRRGEFVTLWLRSANRDPEVYAEPERMWLTPRGHAHLSFGHGPHYCIAAQLGRIEIHALTGALVELVSEVELTGEPRRIESNLLRGYQHLPMTLRPR